MADENSRVILPPGISAEQVLAIAQKHGAKNIRVFGSFARGDARPDSDLDLLIELEPNRDLFDLVDLKQELEDKLGRPVDVLTKGFLSKYIRDDVIRQAIAL